MRRARKIPAVLAFLAISILSPAFAQDEAFDANPVDPDAAESAPVDPAAAWDSCLVLDMRPNDLLITLEKYGTAFGKPAIEWTRKDYDQLLKLATACSGVLLPNGITIDGAQWRKVVDNALRKVFTVAAQHQEVMRRSKAFRTDDIVLPDCGKLAIYKPPARELHDNSAEIFGVPLYGMTRADLDAAIAHMNNCMGFLPKNGQVAFGVPPALAQRVVYAMMDQALIIEARHEEWKTWDKRPTDIQVEFEGYSVPPTFLLEETKALVRRYNRAAAMASGLTLDAVYNLVSITEGMLDDNELRDVDRAYTEAIKKAVADRIFKQTGEAAEAP